MSKKYINADALREIWVWGTNDKYGRSECIPLKDLDDFPAADVRENVRGGWEWRYDDENGRPVYGCSFCNGRVCDAKNNEYIYCPYCGADNRPNKRARI